MKEQDPRAFLKPNAIDRIFNRVFGLLVGLGLGLSHNFLLEVHGRRSGRIYTTPVDVLTHNGRRFLVAGRGYTQWVRNAQVNERVALRKGSRREAFQLKPIPEG